ncbi:MAG: hypothetical protein KDA61_01410 [Planctomycetales bacterium]|nr:hypothetical protein [Planctomycetales bacterium]
MPSRRVSEARRAIADAARRIRHQWDPAERRRRVVAAEVMQWKLLGAMGLQPALAPIRRTS